MDVTQPASEETRPVITSTAETSFTTSLICHSEAGWGSEICVLSKPRGNHHRTHRTNLKSRSVIQMDSTFLLIQVRMS
eukprot:5358907-Amphidinium_carterae.1